MMILRKQKCRIQVSRSARHGIKKSRRPAGGVKGQSGEQEKIDDDKREGTLPSCMHGADASFCRVELLRAGGDGEGDRLWRGSFLSGERLFNVGGGITSRFWNKE